MPINPQLTFDPQSPTEGAEYGIGQARGLLQGYSGKQTDFPENYTAKLTAPTKTPYYDIAELPGMQRTELPDYTAPSYQATSAGPVGGLNRINTPTYQGLMGGDYNQLQSALTDPALAQISERYERGNAAQDARMGRGGLYGSSIQQDAMDQRSKGQAMAESEAINRGIAQRYGMQAQDLANMNQFGLSATGLNMGQEQNVFTANMENARRADLLAAQKNQFNLQQSQNQNAFGLAGAQLGIGQEGDIFKAGLSGALRGDQYAQDKTMWDYGQGEAGRQFGNQNAIQDYQYDLNKIGFDRGIEDELFNKSMSLATGTMPGRNVDVSGDAAEDAALYGALGNVGSGLMGGYLSGVGSQGSWNPLDWYNKKPPIPGV